MEIDTSAVIGLVTGGAVSVLGFLVKHYFEKINKNQETMMADVRTLMEHKFTSTVQMDSMKENWQDMQRKMFEEIKEMNDYCSRSFDKINAKVEKNTIDIQNINSQHTFFAKTLRQILEDRGKKD